MGLHAFSKRSGSNYPPSASCCLISSLHPKYPLFFPEPHNGQAVSNESSKDASEGDGTTFTINNAQQNDGGGKVEVNVNMNPVIKIEGSNMDEEKIFQVLQNRIREMADDLGDEIAERMGKIFNNMPAVQEA